jgi:hypothetical protein
MAILTLIFLASFLFTSKGIGAWRAIHRLTATLALTRP